MLLWEDEDSDNVNGSLSVLNLKLHEMGVIRLFKLNHLCSSFLKQMKEFWATFSMNMHKILPKADAWLKTHGSESRGNSERSKSSQCNCRNHQLCIGFLITFSLRIN